MSGAPGFTAKDSIPVAPGALYGARAFRVGRKGQLTAAAWDYDWTDGVNKATCKVYETVVASLSRHLDYFTFNVPKESHPMAKCDHGFWAYYHGYNEYYDDKIDSLPVAGIVKGYGEAILGERGFRTEKAEIVALTVPSSNKLLPHVFSSSFYQTYSQLNEFLSKGRRAFIPRAFDLLHYGAVAAFFAYSIVTLISVVLGIVVGTFTGGDYFMMGQIISMSVGIMYGLLTVFSYLFYKPKKFVKRYRQSLEDLTEKNPFYVKVLSLATGEANAGKRTPFSYFGSDGGTYTSFALNPDQSETDEFLVQHFAELYPSAKIYTDYDEMIRDYKHLIKNPNIISDK